jgi:hypothetical protein
MKRSNQYKRNVAYCLLYCYPAYLAEKHSIEVSEVIDKFAAAKYEDCLIHVFDRLQSEYDIPVEMIKEQMRRVAKVYSRPIAYDPRVMHYPGRG